MEKTEKVSLLVHAADLICLAVARVNIPLLRVLPDWAALPLARGWIYLMRLGIRRSDKVGLRNLALVFPEKSEAERRQILTKSYEILARNLLTYARLPDLTREKAAQMVDFTAGKALIDSVRARKSGTGVLLPTLHFGSFELLVQFQALLERPIAFLARGFGLPRLDDWWDIRREMFGNEVFTRKGGYQEIVRRLKNGQEVALLFDQNVKPNHAVYVDFFGRKAATTKSIGIAALRTGAPIIFAACVDHGNGRYELIAREIKNPLDEPGTAEEKIERVTRRLHEEVEAVIRKHPEQWFWIHRRYKTRPKGESETLYDDM